MILHVTDFSWDRELTDWLEECFLAGYRVALGLGGPYLGRVESGDVVRYERGVNVEVAVTPTGSLTSVPWKYIVAAARLADDGTMELALSRLEEVQS